MGVDFLGRRGDRGDGEGKKHGQKVVSCTSLSLP